jgi:hypothetical protein
MTDDPSWLLLSAITIWHVEAIALMLHDDAVDNRSKGIYTTRKASAITASDHGIMDTRRRAFTAIMKHNQPCRCCNVQEGNERAMRSLLYESVEKAHSTVAIHEKRQD